jgi:VanZ family protein
MRLKWYQSRILSIGWFILMCVLFTLPGSAFPNENWLSDIYFDKWVHVGLFAVLVFLWSSFFMVKPSAWWKPLLYALIYGLIIEWIQKEFVPNRSFDIYDVIADTVGSVIGLMVWLRVYKKNKPL